MPRDQTEIIQTILDFHTIARFPKVIGAIDGTHIRILSPGGEEAENFRNRKGYFSLNVQVICNSDYIINDVVARWPGSSHDNTIFENSRIRATLENNGFPNCILLGDSAYGLQHFLLTPIQNPVTAAEQLYNESHIRTRTIIERCFGIWKQRFPILSLGMRCKLQLCQEIILATAVLHNIARGDNLIEPELEPDNDDIEEIVFENNNNRNDILAEYINYFQDLL